MSIYSIHILSSYSCKLFRSIMASPNLPLRALSFLSIVLFDFSASRSSLVRLFTAGMKLDKASKIHQGEGSERGGEKSNSVEGSVTVPAE